MNFISRKPSVALLLRTSAKTYREILDGILRYTREQSPWTIQFCQGREANPMEEFVGLSHCNGVIIDETSELFGNLRRFNRIPVVTITSTPPPKRLPNKRISLYCDNQAIGKTAAEHFLKTGFDVFAYVNHRANHIWSRLRGDAFVKTLALKGKSCSIYTSPIDSVGPRLARTDFFNWLKNLPKPVALFAANDLVARHVLDCCSEMKISVPGEIAILSCDNEESICETCTPPLSSIAFSTEQSGYDAARSLDQIMRNGTHSSDVTRLIPYGPTRVVTRLSSAKRNSIDPLVDRALVFIRLNATSSFGVKDLAENLHVSRRTLEIRFKKVLGRGVHQTLLHTRLQMAREQLQTTTLSTDEIAHNCGFPSANHLGAMFRRKFNTTPSTYRKNR